MRATRRAAAVLYLGLSVLLSAPALPAQERPRLATAHQASRLDLRPAFEENRGQTDPRVRFVSRTARQTLFLTADEAVLALRSGNGPAALRLRLRHANTRAQIRGLEPLAARTYYAGPETTGVLPPVPTYRRVRYAGVYPGIDLEYYRTDEHLEFDFTVAPHAAADRIQISLDGADRISRTPEGELLLRVGTEDIVLKRPVAFQMRDGVRRDVSAGYKISGRTVRFELGSFDPTLPLVIDPLIVYATYLGGTGDDFVIGADVDEAGDLYLFGRTNNGTSFPHTQVEPAERTIDPINCFVSKISADGTTLLYSVIFEGFGICEAFELDGDRVHVGMQAQLGNFNGFAQLRTLTFDPGAGVSLSPLKGGALGQIPGRPTLITDIRSDDFGNTYVLFHQLVQADSELQARLLKVDALGNVIDTFDVGVDSDSPPAARGMAVDNFGQVFIVGSTARTITPTPDAFQSTRPTIFSCAEDGFLIRIETNAVPFQQTYATYIAGTGCDTALGVVRDPLGSVYVTGRTTSQDLPIEAVPAIGGPGGDGFLLKFDLSQTPDRQLLAGTYLGLQLGTGSQGVADAYHPIIRLPNGLLGLTGGAIGGTFPLHRPLFDASAAPGYPRFLQLFSPIDFQALFSTHLDAGGTASYAVAAAQKRNRMSSAQDVLFAVTNTPEGGLGTAGRLQPQPAGGEELLIRTIDHSDIENNDAPHVDLGPDITIEAADADGADFDLSCIGCTIVDFDDEVSAYSWTIDGVRHTLTGPPFVGQVTLPVGTHRIELAVSDSRGAIGLDTFVVTVGEPSSNRPPILTLGPDQTVTATSPDGLLIYLPGAVSDPDNDTLDVTWLAGTTTVQFEVFPPYFSGNVAALVRLPIGITRATLRVSDNHGHIETRDVTITVLATNTPAGADVVVTPVDDNFPRASGFTPGKTRIRFAGVTTDGLTYVRTRTNQIPPPPGAPDPRQLGSSPYYYDVTTTATTSGDIRLCVDTTGMSFVDRPAIRLYRLNGGGWDDVTAVPGSGEAAGNFLCGVVPSNGPIVGTFAIFTPASEATRVTTIVGNGGPYVTGTPAPGDGGPANQSAISFPHNFVIDAPRNAAYVTDSPRIRRIDLLTNTISTFAGNGDFGIAEPDGALATDINVSAGGIAVDRSGNVFISGINGCSILRIDASTRRVRRVTGLGPNPTTLECRYDGDGGLATQADINGAGRMQFDADGNLFFIQTVLSRVSAGPGNAVRRVAAGPDHLITGDDPSETIDTVAGGGTQWPPENGDPRVALIDAQDIAFNAQGDLYVGGIAVVVRLTPAPGAQTIDGRPGEQLSVVAGHPILTFAPYQGDGGPALDANLNGPWGIDFLPNGDMLIADTMASRIRLVTAGSDGIVNGGPGEIMSTVAGFTPNEPDINNVPFGGDGYALSTAFSGPRDVVVDPRGGYNVVDTGFNRIRHVGPLPSTVSRADIEVVAEASTLDTGVNVPVTVHVRITNHGPATATNAGVEMPVPVNAQVVSASSPAGFCISPLGGVIGGRVFCEARTMAPGASVLMTVVVNPTGGDDLTVTFTGGATEEDPAPDNNSSTASVRVVTPIDLGVSVTATPARTRVLAPFVYTVTVANLSTRPARIARMNATLPASLRFDGATPDGICSPLGNAITCDVDNFAAGRSLEITLNVTAISSGTAQSSFVVSNPDGDPNPANDSATIGVVVDDLTIVVNEVIHVSDAAAVVPSAMIPVVNETIHVSDGPPTAMGAVMIPVNETIHVSDAVAVAGAGAPTAVGPSVIVRPTDANNLAQPVTVRFSSVTAAGLTAAVPVVPPPAAPAQFTFRGVVYDISTTAAYVPPVEVCFDNGPFRPGDLVWHAGVVLPAGAHTIRTPALLCAVVQSLSPFGVVTQANQPPTANAGVYPPVEATSPGGASVTLVGQGADPDGDPLTFTWTEGATTLGTGAQVNVGLSLGAHDITLTVSDGREGIATSSTRVVVGDTKAPTVLPPPAITVPAGDAGGLRGSGWTALAAFLAGGVATDAVDPAPLRLAPRNGDASVDDNTLFPIGRTVVTFAFRDASGNVGTATSTVTVVVGTPKIAFQVVGVSAGGGNRRFVDLRLTNTGSGHARDLTIDLIALVPLKGIGVPRLATPLPVMIGSLDSGSSTTVRITIDVPPGVKRMSITEIGRFRNVRGQLGAYFGTQDIVP